MRAQVLSILVQNTTGVLNRVSGLFSRRGYNIESITAGVTADDRFTRITIVTSGDELIIEQIVKQLAKLEDVVDIKILKRDESVERELILMKIKASDTERAAIVSTANVFRAKIVDVSRDSIVIELTGSKNKLEAFLNLMEQYNILELARTGVTALSRGADDVKYFD
ncbi:MAG: acetolactate synthase small subunit [Eubacterium sp.]|nr:acetolactate synthase small subunit [Eubacterium sp.]